jgi:hypothetical protein
MMFFLFDIFDQNISDQDSRNFSRKKLKFLFLSDLFQASRQGQGCQTVSSDGGEAETVERPQVLRRRRLNVIRKSFNHFMSHYINV